MNVYGRCAQCARAKVRRQDSCDPWKFINRETLYLPNEPNIKNQWRKNICTKNYDTNKTLYEIVISINISFKNINANFGVLGKSSRSVLALTTALGRTFEKRLYSSKYRRRQSSVHERTYGRCVRGQSSPPYTSSSSRSPHRQYYIYCCVPPRTIAHGGYWRTPAYGIRFFFFIIIF